MLIISMITVRLQVHLNVDFYGRFMHSSLCFMRTGRFMGTGLFDADLLTETLRIHPTCPFIRLPRMLPLPL